MSENLSTTVRDAVRRHKSPGVRLREIARDALTDNPNDAAAARDDFLASVVTDAALLRELCATHIEREAMIFLSAVHAEMRARQKGAGGQSRCGTQTAAAPGATTTKPASARSVAVEAHTRRPPGTADQDTARGAVGKSEPRPLVPPRGHAAAPSAATLAALNGAAAASLLDTMLVNGKPLGDVTAGEALGWSQAQGRRARFVFLLATNLPPNATIRSCRTPAEAEELWQRAGELTNA